ncbi:MAG: hypothetical protein D6681_16995 [Calditrichaeota bacterium]|nr:MAG: hypothetical protein D6681_16995 [Calditrichota bacterium]
MKRVMLLWITLMVLASALLADEKPKEKFSGYMFGDFYWVAANHIKEIENQNGFWLRRIYFTYDRSIAEAFSVRLRLEMNSPGDFTTSSKLSPSVKDAYLKWKSGKTQVILGISPTPTWEVVEKVWGYRSVEKTPLDLQKMGGSRDFGVAVKGSLDSEGKVKYHLMLANGSGTKSETNKGKKALLSLGLYPSKNVIVEAYADWNDLPGDNDVFTFQGFLALKGEKGRIGVQFAQQTHKVEDGEDVDLRVGSVFAVVQASDKVALFGRVDRMFEPNPAGPKISYIPFDGSAKSTFLVGGLDFTPEKTVHLMPNVEVVLYDEVASGVKPDTDVIPRFTFYYIFK